MSTCLGAFPVMMKPPKPALSPVCTRIRVERLMALDGIGAGVAWAQELATCGGGGWCRYRGRGKSE